ncbi:MAG: ferritin-like domain-containing protein [Alphaproteobacteria bacterium]
MKHWTADDIPWDRFDPSKVDPDILKIVKAASMVEKNGDDYALYLCNVFSDDPEFQGVAREWAEEEVQHGDVLGRWAELADASFDFPASFKAFTDGYKLPLDATKSVRGSRAGELVARCIVEVGTSSYYASLGAATDEPVLKAICQRIAADELRHYKLFYTHLRDYLAREEMNQWQRLKVALSRMVETEDDELAYAYYAANGNGEVYDREKWAREYMRRAMRFYQPNTIERAVSMALKAAGFKPNGWLSRCVGTVAWRFVAYRQKKLAAAA